MHQNLLTEGDLFDKIETWKEPWVSKVGEEFCLRNSSILITEDKK